ncbi:MAG TPA: hypothetical protein VHK63_03560 [Candidatus Limnocylindria bacterium]|nr:hypothetical protein [Candidatus Limnocylindria bacterium]
MSREERRAYKRLTKNQDPYALPPAAQRTRGRRTAATRSGAARGGFQFWSGRFLLWSVGGSVAAALLGLSVAWPGGMPFAGYVGLAVGIVWLAIAWVVRMAQQRAAEGRATAAPR